MLSEVVTRVDPGRIAEFKQQFEFRPEGHMLLGVEREFFLVRHGVVTPICQEILEGAARGLPGIGYELSACQMEYQVGPCQPHDLLGNLLEMEVTMGQLEAVHGYRRSYYEVGPVDMPLDVYPDPEGRYAAIAARIPEGVLRAACRVIGTHVHVGMSDHETALRVYNAVRNNWWSLAAEGDGSSGRRLELYTQMAPNHAPPYYEDWEDFYRQLMVEGGASSPRDCYHMIRLSGHGTIEFRMFGSTESIHRVNKWALQCYHLCEEALMG